MKSLNLLVLAAALFIALPASAQQVKPYHQNIKDCAACHTKENAVAGNQFVTPDNKACLTCHQSYAAVAEKTKNLKSPIRMPATITAKALPVRPATPSTRLLRSTATTATNSNIRLSNYSNTPQYDPKRKIK
jgi:predicted CXXCH cytochrome family protein